MSNEAKAQREITYYAVAVNPQGKLGQLLVRRTMSAPGVCVAKSQEWTGVVYKTQREAMADVGRLNGDREEEQ